MRITIILTCALALVAGLGGCKKNPREADPDQPTIKQVEEMEVTVEQGTPLPPVSPTVTDENTEDTPAPAWPGTPAGTTDNPGGDTPGGEQTPAPPATSGAPIGELLGLLDNPASSGEAIIQLRGQGDAVIEQLLAQLQSEDAAARGQAAYALGVIGTQTQAVTDALADLAEKDPDESVRQRARFALDSLQGQ